MTRNGERSSAAGVDADVDGEDVGRPTTRRGADGGEPPPPQAVQNTRIAADAEKMRRMGPIYRNGCGSERVSSRELHEASAKSLMARLNPPSFPSLLLVLATVLGMEGCKSPPDKPSADSAAVDAGGKAPVRATFQRVEAQTVAKSVELTGTLAADETSEVATPAAGSVVAVHVDVGSRVKKGEVLITLDRRDPALRLAQSSATVEQAVSRLGLQPGKPFDPTQVPDVRAAKESMDLAVADADRAKALFESRSVPQAFWDQARTRAEQSRAQYDAAMAGAKHAWATLLGAQAAAGLASKSLADANVRAPFDGAVAEKRIAPGEYAIVGRVVVVLVRDNPLRLRVDVPESEIGNIEVGRDVEVLVAAFPDRVFRGKVKRIGASLRAQSRSLPIEAEIPNDDGKLKPGLFARARITIAGATKQAFFVPRSAVGDTGASAKVYVRQGGHVAERLVQLGRVEGDRIEIAGALSAADEVAVTAVADLVDGAEITP